MANEDLELFVHSQNAKPQVIAGSPSDTLPDVLVCAGIIRKAKMTLAFVGERRDVGATNLTGSHCYPAARLTVASHTASRAISERRRTSQQGPI